MASRRRRKNITPEQWESLGIPREFLETIVAVYKNPEDVRQSHRDAAELCDAAGSAAERLQRNLISLSELFGDDWPEWTLAEVASLDPSFGLPPATRCDYRTVVPGLLLTLQVMLDETKRFLLRPDVVTAAADAIRIQTRALVWLVLAVEKLGVTEYHACYDVAEFMAQHAGAVPGGRALYERVNRFKDEQKQDYLAINSLLDCGYPRPNRLEQMIMYGELSGIIFPKSPPPLPI